MTMRAIVTGNITFGLVAVPIKVYTAASSNAVSFNLLSPEGHRVKQQLVDSETSVEVPRDKTQKGYEFSKGQYVIFTDEELKDLEAKASPNMDIKEFVEESSIPALQVEKTYFLGPNKGGDKGYALLAKTLRTLSKVAIAQWTNRGKEHLVAIRAYEGGLILQQLYYADEIRDFSEVEVAKLEVSEAEEQMAALLVEKMSAGRLDLSKYEDRYAKRIKDAVEAKIQGQGATTIAAAAPTTTVLDLMAALKASLGQGKAPEKAPEPEPENPQPSPKKGRKPRSKK